MNWKKIVWIIVGFILLPIVLAVGVFFFGIVVLIVLGIIILFGTLSFVMYLNRRFKHAMYQFRTKGTEYAEAHVHEKKTYKTQKKGKEQEIVIEHIEEKIEKREERGS
jgi:membrane protein insertase Oxa1/YidC/SpoIIIJ